MEAVLCKAYGPPESLVVEDVPSPSPGPGQVRIAVAAAGLNFPDTLMIAGTYQFKPPFPFSPGGECAGVVAEVGEGVTGLAVGDRVMAVTGHGAFAEEVCADAAGVFHIPDGMSDAEAAGFLITYATVIHSLQDRARMAPGETVLVLGAAGGVGLNAVELGRVMGAEVIACARGADKLDLAKRYGATHLIDYAQEPIAERVKEITGGRGADVIFDPVGGDAFDASLRCIAWQGRLLVVGFASGRIPEAAANRLLIKGCDVLGVFWGSFAMRDPQRNRANVEQLFTWYRAGELRPHVSRTFPLERTADAMNALLSRTTTGKVVLTVAARDG